MDYLPVPRNARSTRESLVWTASRDVWYLPFHHLPISVWCLGRQLETKKEYYDDHLSGGAELLSARSWNHSPGFLILPGREAGEGLVL